ncbi:hypothetical protein SODALDRAFT_48728 [Sodiomyces alkalinus F11]|uniref:Uncharacterized protein n=1 Tax=Sodiomyces alkalinus (strain CBS 110278 / VKM F-3762 / F11) TaxID=1314773 RepID=A0A3N2PMB6_SODAK|nr:hypothetical protein SODALDRAFT_48728 [Sodiomyces alkalinus F11]ROT35682.1 hypothetical protein SODALDRAFT_48728 [Sodiomyces alkalinus F11]
MLWDHCHGCPHACHTEEDYIVAGPSQAGCLARSPVPGAPLQLSASDLCPVVGTPDSQSRPTTPGLPISKVVGDRPQRSPMMPVTYVGGRNGYARTPTGNAESMSRNAVDQYPSDTIRYVCSWACRGLLQMPSGVWRSSFLPFSSTRQRGACSLQCRSISRGWIQLQQLNYVPLF